MKAEKQLIDTNVYKDVTFNEKKEEGVVVFHI